MNTGIRGKQAPPLNAEQWRDAKGNPLETLSLTDLPGRFSLLFFFQSWCPGCHSTGFPTLAKILEHTSRSDLSAVAVQTVFEGHEENPPERAWALQKEHDLQIPFGHDGTAAQSPLMAAYRTGGTPWFVLIDPEGEVVANTFRFDAKAVIKLVSTPSKGPSKATHSKSKAKRTS
jgi:thiol-disulfide isomerase/thioredoxin